MRARARAGLLCAVLAALACASEPRRVVLLGDSITHGIVSGPEAPSYAALLEDRFRGRIEFVNVACGGTKAADWTRSEGGVWCRGEMSLPNLYEARVRPVLPADLVVVMLGTNDGGSPWPTRRTPPGVYGAHLRELVEALRADGAARVMLMAPPAVMHRAGSAQRMVAYRGQVEALCGDRDDVVCGPDVLSLLRAEDFAPGDVHPNGSGHAKIAEALAAALRELP